ncbi:dTDP-4-dehydrorhamnose reductase [Motiliproteus sp. SC1-56]|uniref:dTDP-4-dehydrorhamnose reductase n=1 Tax=Motiliproteus sp. SC1-56 TaxID=2799565 RepID=UPI001A8D7F8F|nr:dTDP-4-dehydrorhamnose reductase [Motiliproteus sp. SC1-56]
MFELPKLLVTGAQGQLGYELVAYAQEHGFDVTAFPRESLDICDRDAVARALDHYQPEFIVNAAAVIPLQEGDDPGLRVNDYGVEGLAMACAERGIALVHLSCAEVFDGLKEGAYREDDAVSPLSAYARSKCRGEAAVRELLDRHIILRTGWLFSARGQSFVRRLVEQGRENRQVQVSDGLVGCPTSAADLGRVVVAMIKQLHVGADAWGTYHYVASDCTSWFGFAEAIVAAARQYEDLKLDALVPVPQEQMDRRLRPARSVLHCERILNTFGVHQRPWRSGLTQILRTLYSLTD